MVQRTLAHLSDLHLGLAGAADAARALHRAIAAAGVDHVVVTGDVTQRGRRREWAAFQETFAPLLDAGRVTVVPGNHDRAEEDVAALVMPGARVQVVERPGLHLVRLDSTAPHNRSLLTAHGHLGEEDLTAVEAAVDDAAPGALVVLALHHHLQPLPGDSFREELVSWLGWPWADELASGHRLLERIHGRCDLVLHGHRHVPSERVAVGAGRPLGVFNAGCSTALGRFRTFRHAGGALVEPPRWIAAFAPRARGAAPAPARAAA